MKIIALLFAGLLWMLPAYAAQDDDQDEPAEKLTSPMAQLGFLLQCTATETSLMHLRLQVAASIEALSAPNQPQPQLAALISSYQMMADAEAKQIAVLTDTIKTAIIPQITRDGKITTDMIMQKSNEMIASSLGQIATLLSDPQHSFADQVMMEKLLLQQSQGCETLAAKVMRGDTI
jgi:hypothetical protein